MPTSIDASAGISGSLHQAELSEAATHSAALIAIMVLIGIGAGLGGMLLAMLLHLIQHLAYGYSLAAVISRVSFLNGVSEAPSWRRLAAMTVCGVVAGLGWWAVYAHGRPLVDATAFPASSMTMPLTAVVLVMEFTRVDHDFLIPILLALGSPWPAGIGAGDDQQDERRGTRAHAWPTAEWIVFFWPILALSPTAPLQLCRVNAAIHARGECAGRVHDVGSRPESPGQDMSATDVLAMAVAAARRLRITVLVMSGDVLPYLWHSSLCALGSAPCFYGEPFPRVGGRRREPLREEDGALSSNSTSDDLWTIELSSAPSDGA